MKPKKLHAQGNTENFYYLGQSSCGDIENGVAFRSGEIGGFVVDAKDILKIADAIRSKPRKPKKVK